MYRILETVHVQQLLEGCIFNLSHTGVVNAITSISDLPSTVWQYCLEVVQLALSVITRIRANQTWCAISSTAVSSKLLVVGSISTDILYTDILYTTTSAHLAVHLAGRAGYLVLALGGKKKKDETISLEAKVAGLWFMHSSGRSRCPGA